MNKATLFTPMRLGRLDVPNRIAVSPMAQYSAVRGCPSHWHFQHLGALAASGPGLIIIESTAVEPQGYGCSACLALHDDDQERAFSRMIEGLRAVSPVLLGLQIGHSGRKASARLPLDGNGPLPLDEGGWRVFGPSALGSGGDWPVPQELDEAGIARVRDAFVATAARAARLNVNLLELHGAHGYLLHSFLSPVSNQRRDSYGGTPENRLRLVREIVVAVRAVWPADRALGIRLNAQDWVAGGLELADTIRIASALKEAGCDYVCVSAGAISAEAKIPFSAGYLAPFAAEIRRAAGIPTLVTGGIHDPRQAEDIVATGQSDGVAIARAFLDDPRWTWRAAEALGESVDYPFQYTRAHPQRWPLAPARAVEPARVRNG
ncbi:MAG: tRNA-dihydrouridine synthase [Microvirga sp.]|nr:tRNA-dihydrouridine synthase [Microvirga sp.]